MSSVQRSVGRGKKAKRLGGVETVDRVSYQGLELNVKVELIRGLIPLGLMHAQELLDEGVRSLAGELYARVGHGRKPGSGRLGGQRLLIRVPRVRGEEGEIPLRAHSALRGSGEVDDLLLRRVRDVLPQR